MSEELTLQCLGCGIATPPTVHQLRCEACGSLLRVEYSAAPSAATPRLPKAHGATLGEGNTPVVRLETLADRLGLNTLWAKLEFMAPTGSFKDRGSAVLVSVALSEGVAEFVEDSSGNAGASLAAYAAAAGIKAHVFAPASASPGKLDQVRIFGAELHTVDGPRQAATDAAERFVSETGMPYLSHNLSPFFSEGMKPVAYEVERSEAAGIDHIVLPVGNGSLLIGTKRGYDELVASGASITPPRFHAVQSDAVMPVISALNNSSWTADMAAPTRASGIAVAVPPRLTEMVDAVVSSGGSGVTVSDREIIDWRSELARVTGVFCEPTSATAFAGLQKLIERGDIPAGADVLVPVTGSGLKEPA